MFSWKLWKAKPKKVLAAGGAYLEVYSVDSIKAQKVALHNHLENQAWELEQLAKRTHLAAKQILDSV